MKTIVMWLTTAATLGAAVSSAWGQLLPPIVSPIPVPVITTTPPCVSEGATPFAPFLGTTLASVLNNRRVCLKESAGGPFRNQEDHIGGRIIERGNNQNRDLGSYTVNGSSVTYTYTQGGSYTFTYCVRNDSLTNTTNTAYTGPVQLILTSAGNQQFLSNRVNVAAGACQ